MSFDHLYSGVQDPLERVGRYHSRLVKDYSFDAGTDFASDIELPIDMVEGLLWDLSVAVDSTDWSLIILAKPGLIAGATPTTQEMIDWAFDIVIATGAVAANWYTLQYTQMSPKYFNHFGQQYTNYSLYARFMSATAITTGKMRLVLSHLA